MLDAHISHEPEAFTAWRLRLGGQMANVRCPRNTPQDPHSPHVRLPRPAGCVWETWGAAV